MKKTTLFFALFVGSIGAAYSQSLVKGKLFLNNKEFNTKGRYKYFDFKPLTTKLTKNGTKYLDEFGDFYLKSKTANDTLKIVLDLALTINEYKVVNNQVGILRTWVVYNYLQRRLNISINKAIIKNPKILVYELTGIIVEH